jgi:hypothetical protein
LRIILLITESAKSVRAKSEMPRTKLLANLSTDGKRAKVENPTAAIQITAIARSAFL